MSSRKFGQGGMALLAVGLVCTPGAIAQEPTRLEPELVGQVTSVSQLSDVQTTDWAFTALQSLVERYGCIAGYPDRTYRGQRAMSRFEFAAGLNACLDKINELITTGLADKVGKDDLATLRRLQEEFALELATLKSRVNTLEGKVEKLEAQQFSTTTKLAGEAIFSVADTFGERTGVNQRDPSNLTFAARVRLNFNTSFTGTDLLRVRLQAGNVPGFNTGLTGTNMTRLSYDTNTNNDVRLDDLFYRFSLGRDTRAWILLNGAGTDGIAPNLNPLENSGRAALSRFGRFSPTYRLVDGTGFALDHKFSDSINLTLAYRVPTGTAASPNANAGFFGGTYGAFGQLTFSPSQNFRLGVHYVRNYFGSGGANLTGSTGSNNARQPFGNLPTSADTYGLAASLVFSPQFIVSGWAGFTNARSENGPNQSADSFNAALTFAFPDLFGRGNLGGLIVGIPPKSTANTDVRRVDPDTAVHLEGFYRFQVSRNISITPGGIVIFNPEHNSRNATQVVGVIRTTFNF